MDERCADELVASGDLTPDWRPSFLVVPRQRFIPRVIWHEVDDVMPPVLRADDPDRWLELASGKDSVATQVDDCYIVLRPLGSAYPEGAEQRCVPVRPSP